MWISRAEYENLTRRIEKLEDRLAGEKVYYGRERDYYGFGQPLLPAKWHYSEVNDSESISVNVLLIRIAEYLGFKMEPRVTTGGGLVVPPKPKLDMPDACQQAQYPIRPATGNKTRVKQEKPR